MITDYNELGLQSVDLLLCSGEGDLSKRIQWFQRITGWPKPDNELSHVAAVYKTTKTGLSVIESTTLNKWCGKKGVQINPFNEWLDNYNGRVWVKQLFFNRKPYNKKILDFWLANRNRPYEHGIPGMLELFLCGLMLSAKIKKIFPNFKPLQTKNPHCTELIAELLVALDMFTIDLDTNRMPPALWWNSIDEWFKDECSKPIRLK